MSSLSHSPYIETINYWRKTTIVKDFKIRFLLTKLVEMHSFKKNAFPLPDIETTQKDYSNFANPIKNSITANSKTCIVVPCYIRTEVALQQLKRLHESIANQNKKTDFVIFVDDCSPYKYEKNEFSDVIFLQLEHNYGPATARNKGLEYALSLDADIIAFTDSDCILSTDWLSSIYKTFLENKNAQILSGNTLSYGNTWFDKYHNLNGTLNGRRFKDKDYLLYGPTANLAITSQVGISIEFDDSFPNAAGEDIDFCLQANKKGFRIYFCPKMDIKHDYSYGNSFIKNLKQFRNQFKRYATGERILLQKNPAYYMYFEQTKEIPAIEYSLDNNLPS